MRFLLHKLAKRLEKPPTPGSLWSFLTFVGCLILQSIGRASAMLKDAKNSERDVPHLHFCSFFPHCSSRFLNSHRVWAKTVSSHTQLLPAIACLAKAWLAKRTKPASCALYMSVFCTTPILFQQKYAFFSKTDFFLLSIGLQAFLSFCWNSSAFAFWEAAIGCIAFSMILGDCISLMPLGFKVNIVPLGKGLVVRQRTSFQVSREPPPTVLLILSAQKQFAAIPTVSRIPETPLTKYSFWTAGARTQYVQINVCCTVNECCSFSIQRALLL